MKVIKFITVFIAVVVLLSTSLMPVSASDDTILYGMTHEQMLQFGYEYENGVYTLPSGIIPPEAYFPATMLIEEPRFPDIDPRKIPWSTAPSYIQDVVYMGIEGASTTNVNDYKMPFVAVRVNANNIKVYVGLNCGLGRISNTGNIRICSINPSGNAKAPQVSYCYVATFSHSYEVSSDWVKCSSDSWGDTGNVLTYNTSSFFTPSNNIDLYLYGGNGVITGSVTSVTVTASDTANVTFYVDQNVGFVSGRYFPNTGEYSAVYVQTFTPPTPEEVEQETQKGILATLKSIPDKIGEFFDNLKNYLLYFQAEKPEHVNPFAGILTDVQNFFDSQIEDTSDFKDSLNSTFENVSTYISTGSSVINKLLEGVPLLNAFLIFFVVIAVIRKVVGR